MTNVGIRWLIRRDMADVLRIEAAQRGGWTEEEFLQALRQRNCIGMVAEHNGQIVGFMVYELHKDCLSLCNFGVDPAWRRRRIGQQMVGRMVDKLNQQRRSRIEVLVPDTHLSFHQFLKATGFTVTQVVRDGFTDLYLFEFLLNPPKRQWHITNRISAHLRLVDPA